MRLKRFATDRFAGISKRELSFQEGLNVILGPNEAGKSTLIEAIFATIFKEAKLRMNLGADKEFKKRFMPYPDGDYINGILEFEINGKIYSLRKEWGDNHSAALELPDGTIITNNQKIVDYLKDLFAFGQATYGNVVFARQDDVKEVIYRISSDDSIINTVSTFLRKAVMELDGISVEKLRNKIEEELALLLKRWDLKNDRPDNPNRDINNPYKVGYGQIYQAYLDKAGTELKMEEVKEIEDNFAKLSKELKELEKRRETISAEIKEMAKLEDDIFKRGRLEPEIKRLTEKEENLKKINQQWPLKKEKIKRMRKELESFDQNIKELKKEKLQARRIVELKQKKLLLDKVDQLKKGIKEKEEIKINKISAEDIRELERLNGIIKKYEAFLEASTLIVKLNKAEKEVLITRGVEEKENIFAGEEVKADAYLRVEVEDLLDIEVQAAEINFEKLKDEYQVNKKLLKELLERLKVESISEAKLTREKYLNKKNELKNLQSQIDNLLAGNDYDKLKEEVAGITDIKSVRNLEEIESDLEEINNKRLELVAEGRSLGDQLKNWQNEYGEPDNLLDKLVEIKVELRNYKKEIADLAELPKAYHSVDEFKNRLSLLREKKEEIDHYFNEKREELADITAKLPEESYEELALVKAEYQRKYDNLVKRAINLLKTQKVVERKLEEMDDNTFTPLVDSFSKYLASLTAGNYHLGNIDEDFQLKIKDDKDQVLPVDIDFLSYGTYDGVALAFRFALIEQLFKKEGFIVLDDCLVNLDPKRKREAIKLINEFANDFQLIFTTCNPETARELGGNLIELSS